MFQDVCWQDLSEDYVCSQPLVERQTTYTECCCLYGEAWGMQCALCPMKDSGEPVKLIPVHAFLVFWVFALPFPSDKRFMFN